MLINTIKTSVKTIYKQYKEAGYSIVPVCVRNYKYVQTKVRLGNASDAAIVEPTNKGKSWLVWKNN